MSVTEQARTEVIIDAEYGCALTHPRFGRCSANAVEVHHVTYRSAGGSDDADNLLAVCPRHHRLIHERRMWRVEEDGRLYFDEGHGDERVRWAVWPEVRDEYERDYEAHRGAMELAGAMLDGSALAWCWHLWQMDQRSLWQAGGWDSLHEFVQSIRPLSKPAINNHLRVARTYFDHLGFSIEELSEVRLIERPDGEPQTAPATFADLRAAAAIAQRLPREPESKERIREHLGVQPVGQLRAALQDDLEDEAADDARERGVDRVEMTGTGSFSFVLTMDSTGDEKQDRAEFRKRVAGITRKIAVAGGLDYKRIDRRVVN